MKKKVVTKKQLEAEAAYQQLVKKWATVPKFARQKHPPESDVLQLDLRAPPGRESPPKLPSRVTAGGSTAPRETIKYTGTKMLGIGQMHKSNSVPIFSAGDAVDVAKMRRN